MLLALLFAASAATPEVWAAMYSGRLSSATERDPAQAAAIYEAVLDHLPEDDPIRGELLYWLAWARHESGDVQAAVDALRAAHADDSKQRAISDLLELISVWEGRVHTLPYQTPSAMTLEDGDQWRLAFDDLATTPDTIRLKLRAEQGAALLRLELTDLHGARWEQEILEIADGEWLEMELSLSELRPIGRSSGPPGQHPWMLKLEPAAPLTGPVIIAEIELR